MAQVVVCSCSKCEALISNHSIAKKGRGQGVGGGGRSGRLLGCSSVVKQAHASHASAPKTVMMIVETYVATWNEILFTR
jgi:hypothetical protein